MTTARPPELAASIGLTRHQVQLLDFMSRPELDNQLQRLRVMHRHCREDFLDVDSGRAHCQGIVLARTMPLDCLDRPF